MGKNIKGEIREAERKKLLKQFEHKHKALLSDVERYSQLYHKTLEQNRMLANENYKLKQANEKLEEENRIYKDWTDRLQEFVNIPEDVRSQEVKNYIESVQKKADFNALLGTYTRLFGMLFQ